MVTAILVIILLVFGYFVYQYWRYRTNQHGAPYVALDQEIVDRMLQLAQVGPDDVVYDLGSGDGRIPLMAALKYGARAVGIEVDKLRYLYSKLHAYVLRLNNRVVFLNQNFFDVNIAEATIVTMYLLPETNQNLAQKLLSELKPGTIVISSSFDFPSWVPEFVDYEHSTDFGPLYVYEIGKSNPTTQISPSTPAK